MKIRKLSIILLVIFIFSSQVFAVGNSPKEMIIEYDFLAEVFGPTDIIAMSNVLIKLDKEEYIKSYNLGDAKELPFIGENYFRYYVEVDGSTTLTTLKPDINLRAFKLVANNEQIHYDKKTEINMVGTQRIYLTDEITGEYEPKDVEIGSDLSGYDLFFDPSPHEGSTLTIDQPGYYLVTSRYSSLDGSPSIFIKVLAEENSKIEAIGETTKVKTTTKTIKVKPTASNVLVNGKQIEFDAYMIDNNNYFKLRDLAKVINGTEKQFEVGWDPVNKSINLVSGQAYISVGGELTKDNIKNDKAIESKSPIYKDGQAFQLKAYTVGNNNYFKLRDIGRSFDFGVGWDNVTKTITIDTSIGYTED